MRRADTELSCVVTDTFGHVVAIFARWSDAQQWADSKDTHHGKLDVRCEPGLPEVIRDYLARPHVDEHA